jgi:hypothetical protein
VTYGAIPANWYPDPAGGGGLRYWDGADHPAITVRTPVLRGVHHGGTYSSSGTKGGRSAMASPRVIDPWRRLMRMRNRASGSSSRGTMPSHRRS